jgi:hypothetical protein
VRLYAGPKISSNCQNQGQELGSFEAKTGEAWNRYAFNKVLVKSENKVV